MASGAVACPQRTVIYGAGGIGKTELAANIQLIGKRPLFIDIGTGSAHLNVSRISDAIDDWDALRGVLQAHDLFAGFNVVVLDDLTKAEELATTWTLGNVPRETRSGGKETVTSIEGYGWGKGYMHVYETFLRLLGDLDAHIRAGREVICIAHDCTTNTPNPMGDDFLRFEPRLQSPKNGAGSIRNRVKEWADHLFFVGYDLHVNTAGKAMGSGSRTIYPTEMPTHLAKSRKLGAPIPYGKGSALLWQQLYGAK